MSNAKGRLGEILIAAGKLDPEQLEAGLAQQRETGQPLGMTLVRLGVLEEQALIRTLAVQLSLPMARLHGKRVNSEVLELVPADLAEKHHCFPLFLKDESDGTVLYLGMEDATNLDALDDVTRRVGMKVRAVLVATSEIDAALQRHYPPGGVPVGERSEEAWAGEASGAELGEGALTRAEPEPGDPEPAAAAAGIQDDVNDLPAVAGQAGPEAPAGLEAASAPAERALEGPAPAVAPPAEPLAADPDADTDDQAPPPTEPDLSAAPEEGADAPAEPAAARAEPSPAATDAAASDRPAPAGRMAVSHEAILRALSQLLVEKGVFTREELIARVQRESEVASRGPRSRS